MLKKIISTLLFGTLTIAALGSGIKSNASNVSNVTEDSSAVEITSEDSVNEELDDLGIMTGAWSISDSATMTDDIQKIFDKAVDGITGVTYEPIAYLGSQVVVGTNYCFLCKATVVYPTATPYYTLMHIYEDFDGNVEIADIQDIELGCGIKSNASNVTEDSSAVEITSEDSVNEELDDLGIMTGAWSISDSATMTDDIQEIFDKAVDGITGATYEPIAYLGSQVVAGTNYCFLCKATVAHPTATPYYTLMHIYEGPDGNVEIADIQDIELGY